MKGANFGVDRFPSPAFTSNTGWGVGNITLIERILIYWLVILLPTTSVIGYVMRFSGIYQLNFSSVAMLFLILFPFSTAESAKFDGSLLLADQVSSLAFNDSGDIIYIGDTEGNIKQWDLSTGEIFTCVKSSTDDIIFYNLIELSRDGIHALVGYSSGEIRYVDLNNGNDLWKKQFFDGDDALKAIALSPDGVHGIASDKTGRIVYFEVSDGKVIWNHDQGETVQSVAFSADSSLIFEAEGSRLRAETLEGYLAPFDFEVPNSGYSSFSSIDVSDDNVVVGEHYDALHLYDGNNGKRLRIVDFKETPTNGKVAISRNGKFILAQADKGRVSLFDVRTGKSLGMAQAIASSIDALAISHDGSRFAMADHDGRVSLWRKGPKQIAGARIWDEGYVVYTPNGDFIVEPGNYSDSLGDLDVRLSDMKPDKIKLALSRR